MPDSTPSHDLLRCPQGHDLRATWIATPPSGRGRWGWLACECATYPVIDDIPVMLDGVVDVHSDFMSGSLMEGQPVTGLVSMLQGEQPLDALIALLAMPIGLWPLTRSDALRRQMASGGVARTTTAINGMRLRRMLARRDSTTVRDWLVVIALQTPFDGDTYNYFLHRFSQPRHLASLSLIEGLPAGPVLDLACGVGHTSFALSSAGHPVIGLDHNFASVWLARWWMSPDSLMICGDATTALPLADGSVGSAMCIDAFHYLPNQTDVLAQMSRVADGGPLLISRVSRSGTDREEGHAQPVEGWRDTFGNVGHAVLHAETDLVAGYLAGRSAGGPTDSPSIHTDPWLSATISPDGDDWPAPGPFTDGWPHARGELGINPVYRPDDEDPETYVFEEPSEWYADENGDMAEWMPSRLTLTATQRAAVHASDANGSLAELIAQHVVIGMPESYTSTLQRPLRATLRRRISRLRTLLPG